MHLVDVLGLLEVIGVPAVFHPLRVVPFVVQPAYDGGGLGPVLGPVAVGVGLVEDFIAPGNYAVFVGHVFQRAWHEERPDAAVPHCLKLRFLFRPAVEVSHYAYLFGAGDPYRKARAVLTVLDRRVRSHKLVGVLVAALVEQIDPVLIKFVVFCCSHKC